MKKRVRIILGLATTLAGMAFLAYFAAGELFVKAFVGIAESINAPVEVQQTTMSKLSPFLGVSLILIGSAILFLPSFKRWLGRIR